MNLIGINDKIVDVSGRVITQQVYEANGVCWQRSDVQKNMVCYDWGVCAAALFRGLQDGKDYKIDSMYLEFDNSGADVNPVPTIARTTYNSYYRSLTGTADFIKVPLIATSGSASSGDFSGDNVAVFYAQSTGTTGSRTTSPLTFSDGAGSRIYGAALVATLDSGDTTQDLIVSRIYFAPGSQVEKVAGSQIGVTWALTFG